jgi:lipopolysaccharide biosynthesis regulator YciM
MVDVASELWPWLIGALVVGLGGVALRQALVRPRTRLAVDVYEQAIERWLAGDLAGARDLLREVVRRDSARVQPYLQLGILLRLTGDPGRAAVMHRSLAVRPELPPGRRVIVGLELATDLLALGRPDEADEVLQQLAGLAGDQERWYRARFAAALALGHVDRADQALREGVRKAPAAEREALQALHTAWLTDRALQHIRTGEPRPAGKLLAQASKLPGAESRVFLLRALHAAAEQDAPRAVAAVAEGLARHPVEMAPALHLLEGVLLETGRFTLVIPILESACQQQEAPPALWMALARLYEKLDRRGDALRLLAGKRGDQRLTPDAAAPYLRLLTADHPDAAFSRVWNLLSAPGVAHGQQCTVCGRREPDLRWFCPDCLSPDSFRPAVIVEPVAAIDTDQPEPAPPRY